MVQGKLLAFLSRFFGSVLFLKNKHVPFKTAVEWEPVLSSSVLDKSVKEFCYNEK